jgi:4-carboxymuconolactone decarboxylase
MSDLDTFDRPLQDWLNERAWGSRWLRDGLDLKNPEFVYMCDAGRIEEGK